MSVSDLFSVTNELQVYNNPEKCARKQSISCQVDFDENNNLDIPFIYCSQFSPEFDAQTQCNIPAAQRQCKKCFRSLEFEDSSTQCDIPPECNESKRTYIWDQGVACTKVKDLSQKELDLSFIKEGHVNDDSDSDFKIDDFGIVNNAASLEGVYTCGVSKDSTSKIHITFPLPEDDAEDIDINDFVPLPGDEILDEEILSVD
ncbi:hypothetical protein SK128_008519, partial [Halocaridina rubra]